MRLNTTLAGLIAGASLLAVSPVNAATADNSQAQESNSSAAAATSQTGTSDAEIVVTARKRSETLLSVPVVVSAFSAEELNVRGTRSIDDIAEMTPSLAVQSSGGSSPSGQVVLRGITTTANSAAAEQAVMIAIDGLPIASALALRGGQIDLQQVEILKGPQALYFGKNASAGVISLKSADPTAKFFAQLRTAYEFEAGERTGEIVVSGPVTDTMGVRVVGNYTGSDGYFKNIASIPVTVRNRPGYEEFFGRLTLKWSPSSDLSARLKVSYTDHDGSGYVTTEKISCSTRVDPEDDCRANGVFVKADPVNGERPYDKFKTFIGSLEVKANLSRGLNLTSLTGYYDIKQDFMDTVTPTQRGSNIWTNPQIGTRAFSQEVRIATSLPGPFNAMIGGFYEASSIDLDGRLSLARPTNHQNVEGRSFSIFGETTINLSSGFELSGGARYTRDKKRFAGYNKTAAGGLPAGPWIIAPPRRTFENVSPEATLTWRPDRNLTVFATYKQGFKAGSYQVAPAANTQAVLQPLDISFNSEEAKGGEFGVKAALFDRTLTLTAAAYYYNYKDLQLSTFDPVTASTRIINAGKARVQGVEAELGWQSPVEGLSFRGGANYNRARYLDFLTDCSATQTATKTCPIDFDHNGVAELQNLGGTAMPNAPEWSGYIGFNLDRPFLRTGAKFRLGGNANYSSSYQTEVRNDPRGFQSAFWSFNLSAGLRDDRRGWALDVIGRNLTNRYWLIRSVAPLPGTGIPGDVGANVARGRQILVQLTLRPTDMF